MACPSWQSDPTGSKFADEGTVAHHVAAKCLIYTEPADTFTSAVFGPDEIPNIATRVQVTQEMAEYVQAYIDYVVSRADGHQLLVEEKLEFSDVVGVPDQFGTSDAVILRGDEIEIVDLKYGKGVRVDAAWNPQLLIYALAAVRAYEAFGFDFQRVVTTVHQPRLDHVDSATYTMDEIEEFQRQLQAAVERVLEAQQAPAPTYNPGEKQCRWCARKANCPAVQTLVQDTIGADFDDLTAAPAVPEADAALASAMRAVEFVEEWCKAVRAEVERRLLAGGAVEGWKLVEGKRGARAWADEKAAEELLRGKFRLTYEEAYDMKLISPTKAEKVLKDSPRRWAQLEPLITQNGGKPSVAPSSDKRPTYSVAADFSDLTQ
jgi:hypothetical protein